MLGVGEAVRAQVHSESETLIRKTGERIEASAALLDSKVERLDLQQQRVEALAGELQVTVRELDETKDELLALQGQLETKRSELDQTRERLGRREGELAHQQAKLAALTLILEGAENTQVETQELTSAPDSPAQVHPLAPLEPGPVPLLTLPTPGPAYRYRFLPPNAEQVL